jgi:UDP-2,3-diacylglucosamine pyrophosphatase LpxH
MHLSLGRPPGRHTFSRLESFFYDDVFERFLARLRRDQRARGRRATLVLGGDVFDFLVITEVPDRKEALAEGISVSAELRRVGLSASARHAAWKLRRIARGHPRFFEAVARWLRAGHRVVVVTGNHDAELYWARVRETLVDLLLLAADRVAENEAGPRRARDADALAARIEFRQWFYYEPGRLYYEHGNQYEASNCFRYNLCPEASGGRRGERGDLDLPVGSLFVRYLFNSVRQRKPYLANMVSMEQYMSAVARLNLVEMIGVLFRRLPFFRRALRAAKTFEDRSVRQYRRIHEHRLEELAEREGLPAASLQRIQAQRAMPDGMTKYRLADSILRPVLGKTLKYLVYAVAIFFVWFLAFSLIQSTPWVAEGVLGKASLTALLAVLTVIAVLVLLNRLFSRLHHVPAGVPPNVYEAARVIARETGVLYVVMGHTHLAECRPLQHTECLFANTGTWTALSGMWEMLWPGNRRFSFVRLRGDTLELLRWNDQAQRFDEVYQFEDYRPRPSDVLYPEEPAAAEHLGGAAPEPLPGKELTRLDPVERLRQLGRTKGG